MSKSSVFISASPKRFTGAQLAIVTAILSVWKKDRRADTVKPVAGISPRIHLWRAELDGKAVIVYSTGIGGPSLCRVEGLCSAAGYSYRFNTRIGTTGAIQPHINVGDVLVTTASVHLDGGERHRTPRFGSGGCAPFACTTALRFEAAKSIGATTHTLVTASSNRFLSGSGTLRLLFWPRCSSLQRLYGRKWRAVRDDVESLRCLTMCAPAGFTRR